MTPKKQKDNPKEIISVQPLEGLIHFLVMNVHIQIVQKN
jgi:hypothetical protein